MLCLRLTFRFDTQVQEAVEGLGGRVSIGDVAAQAGVRVSEAEEALNALAADSNASIQVSHLHILHQPLLRWCKTGSGPLQQQHILPFLQDYALAPAHLAGATAMMVSHGELF